MNDEPDIFLVYSHPKGIGGDYDANFIVHKGILAHLSGITLHTSRVLPDTDSSGFEEIIDFLYVFDRCCVDDTASGSLLDNLGYFLEFFFFLRDFPYEHDDIFSVESVDKLSYPIEPEAFHDVGPDFLGGGCGEGDDRNRASETGLFVEIGLIFTGPVPEIFDKVLDLHITRTKVMSPLADTVGFVDGDESDLYSGHDLQELLVLEAFWGDVDELDGVFPRVADLLEDIALFLW